MNKTDLAIYIIGTIHEDLEGRERLISFLNYAKPNVIGVGYSKKRLKFLVGKLPKTIDGIYDSLTSSRKALMEKLSYIKSDLEKRISASNISDREREEIESILLPIKLTMSGLYEVEEPVFYWKYNQSCKVELIDLDFIESKEEMNGFSKKKEEAIEELEKELKADGLSHQKFVDRLYSELNKDNIEKIYESDLKRKILDTKRNNYMASIIKQLVKTNPNKTHVYIVGLLHLYALADRLSDLSPVILPLLEAYKMSSIITTESGK